jgi:hypothetical protein
MNCVKAIEDCSKKKKKKSQKQKWQSSIFWYLSQRDIQLNKGV